MRLAADLVGWGQGGMQREDGALQSATTGFRDSLPLPVYYKIVWLWISKVLWYAVQVFGRYTYNAYLFLHLYVHFVNQHQIYRDNLFWSLEVFKDSDINMSSGMVELICTIEEIHSRKCYREWCVFHYLIMA